jgi:hypothetical protein
MKTPWILSTAALAGPMMIASALGAPPAGKDMVAPLRADVVRVQAVVSPEAPANRMARLRQHRSILQNALQPQARAAPVEPPVPQARATPVDPPVPQARAAPVEPPVPQARALRPPEPVIETAPTLSQSTDEGQGQMTCEAAAQIVADFGFSDIGPQECSGDLYRFSAMRDGTAYAIGISAATGEIAEVSRQ